MEFTATYANGSPPCNDGGSYNPATKTWTAMAKTPSAPTVRINHSTVWTGRDMIICDGGDGSGNCFGDTWSCTPPQLLYLYQRP